MKRTKQAAAQIQQSVTSHFFWSFRVIYQYCYPVALHLCNMPLEIFFLLLLLFTTTLGSGSGVSVTVPAVRVRKLSPGR